MSHTFTQKPKLFQKAEKRGPDCSTSFFVILYRMNFVEVLAFSWAFIYTLDSFLGKLL